MRVSAVETPEAICDGSLATKQVVVIDALRASATITQALQAGARGVVPCLTVEEARARASDWPGCVLGGERRGVRIEGFDLGNSPYDYFEASVGGRMIVFTTTNGTKALLASAQAGRVLVGCVNHLNALSRDLLRDGRHVVLVCAGTDGGPTEEDSLSAALIATTLREAGAGMEPSVLPMVKALEAYWKFHPLEGLGPGFREARGGQNLLALGYGHDIEWCCRMNSHTAIGQYDATTGVISAIKARV